MASLEFGSKAGNLVDLTGRLEHSSVLPMVVICRTEWDRDAAGLTLRVIAELGVERFAVRSSAPDEDLEGQSNAGRYETFLNVQEVELRSSVDRVFASYEVVAEDDEVFLQPMVRDVELLGVAFSCDPSTGSAYRVIEYATGDDTSLVTGGHGLTTTLVCLRGRVIPDERLGSVIRAIEELEGLYEGSSLDIEFAISGDIELPVLLQVRPLAVSASPLPAGEHLATLDRIANRIREAQQPHPFLAGESTVFGIMPDWNPAEIIGVRPRPLSMSLYRDVVTDSIWAYQRSNYGYRNLRGHPLMVEFAGQPFIDVRVSFNSFIPADLSPTLASRLVNHYVQRLVDLPEHHDKIEFEIVHSCYVLGMRERLEGLLHSGFTDLDIRQVAEALRHLTNRVLNPTVGLWKGDWERIGMLEARRREIAKSSLNIVSRIHWLLEDCRRYGTLPFAGLARCGFIARQLLDSLSDVGILTPARRNEFLASVRTVNGRLVESHASADRDSFLAEFGHLRPGTYEIMSRRYDESPDYYFDFQSPPEKPQLESATFEFSPEEAAAVDSRMGAEGLVGNSASLLEFLRAGIELREEAKFQFTHNVSDLLVLLSQWGVELGLTREDMSFVRIDHVKEALTTSADQTKLLWTASGKGRVDHASCRAVWLPSLLTQPDDVYRFELFDGDASFVTQKSVIARIGRPEALGDMKGRIAVVPSADPGFDWLFAAGIVGLITTYGGVNSHMAIRSYELGLPAAIGIGEQRMGRIVNASRLLLDCESKRIEIIE